MLDLSTILAALTQIRQWFESLRTHNTYRDERYQEALGSLYTALNETRIYIGWLDRGRYGKALSVNNPPAQRNEETEAKLSRLWTTAALKLRNIDHELAERCMLKGDYWANPEAWSEDKIKRARIQIDSVFREARKLL